MARKRGEPKLPDRKRLRARFLKHFHAVKARVATLSLRTPKEAASVTALCAISGAYPDAGVLSTIGLGAIGSLWANYLSRSGHSEAPTEVPPELIQQFFAHDQAQRELIQFLEEYDLQAVVVEEFGPEALSQFKVVVGEALDKHGVATKEDIERLRPTVIEPVTPPAPAAPTLPIFSVPHPRNPNFTGRSHLLTTLRHSLTTGGHTALTQAVHGLGGVGKTQLALEYAYLHAPDYTVIYWVRSEDSAQLASDYAALAEHLNLSEKNAPDQTEIIAAVRRWLEQSDGWLLIFDNAPHPDALPDYLPHGGAGHIIITSRDPNWGSVAAPLEVPTWPRDESIAFLEKRTGHGGEDAAALAHELGDLPLALEQAAAYIEAADITLPQYLDLFRTRREDLWKDEQPPLDYGKTVAATLTIAMQQVEKESPAAADLLNLCAFLAPDDIPLSLFRDHADHLPEPLKSTVADTLALNNAVAALRRYSLVYRDEHGISVHRLVQAVARHRLPDERKNEWAAVAAAIVNAAFPFRINDVDTWGPSARVLAHALAVAGHAADLHVASDDATRLLNQAGLYLQGRAAFMEAKSVFERAVSIGEAALGPDHPTVAIGLNNLAVVLRQQGDLAGARERYERALEIDLAAYGPEHPTVAIRLNNLAMVLEKQGDLAGARERFERALEIDLAAYGPEHPNVARWLNNLAGVLEQQGDLAGAQERFERALEIDLAAYGPEHPNVARGLNNLAMVLEDQGDLAGAQERFERALEIFEKVLGEKHPNVATLVNNLAMVLQAQGNLAGAREHLERALEIDEAAYGPDHPAVAGDVSNLAGVLRDQGDLAGAREHYERALRILQQVLGDDHPKTQLVGENLESLDT